jgi:hypothetical protein
MAKMNVKPNAYTNQIFEDLEKFKDFCVSYGYKVDERNLYDMRSYVFQQFSKYTAGKFAKDMWAEDARRLGILL